VSDGTTETVDGVVQVTGWSSGAPTLRATADERDDLPHAQLAAARQPLRVLGTGSRRVRTAPGRTFIGRSDDVNTETEGWMTHVSRAPATTRAGPTSAPTTCSSPMDVGGPPLPRSGAAFGPCRQRRASSTPRPGLRRPVREGDPLLTSETRSWTRRVVGDQHLGGGMAAFVTSASCVRCYRRGSYRVSGRRRGAAHPWPPGPAEPLATGPREGGLPCAGCGPRERHRGVPGARRAADAGAGCVTVDDGPVPVTATQACTWSMTGGVPTGTCTYTAATPA